MLLPTLTPALWAALVAAALLSVTALTLAADHVDSLLQAHRWLAIALFLLALLAAFWAVVLLANRLGVVTVSP